MKVEQYRDVLLVVDVQNDFCPGGRLPVPYGYEVVPTINWLSKKFDNVILTQDWHPEGHISFASTHDMQPFDKIGDLSLAGDGQVYWPDHCVRGTKGADFHPSLDIPHAQLILRKGWRKNLDSYSAFSENDRFTSTGLAGYAQARGFNRFFIAGLSFDFCVKYTAFDARRLSKDVFVIEEACRAIGDPRKTKSELEDRRIGLIKSADFII